ncbi:MAG TPA: MMPL family transporter [Steroidobacteraceae bacterium]|nr:MMPL family transporter [Steroidobacteraceae bacterium]
MSALPAGIRTRFLLWSVLMVGMLTAFALQVLPNLKVETDILALLPNAQQDPAMDEALNAFSAKLARRQMFLVGATDLADAKLAATSFTRTLQDTKAFANVMLELDANALERFDTYLDHRSYLLTEADEKALREGRGDQLVQQAIRAAFTPAGLMQPLSLAQDPLGLMNNFLRAQVPAFGNARLDGATLVVEAEVASFVLVLAESSGSPFASSVQESVMPAIAQASIAARRAVPAAITILSSGAIQHAAAATQRATKEISTFGTIEVIAVIVLLWAILGAIRPLILAVLTLSLAVIAAFTVVHFTFGKVHLLALVFGSSLIGSVIDYSIHFFADRFRDPGRWSPVAAVSHVGPAILLGLTTTLIGYLVLAFVPFPGLKQIAVFCMVGLIVGCGCVLCFYPLFVRIGHRRPPQLGPRLGAALDRFLQRWRWTTPRIAAVALVLLAIGFGLTRVHIQDDVRALQDSPPELIENEQQVRELLGSTAESRFFLVTGDSEQALLEHERRLTDELDRIMRERALSSYQAVSTSLPSLAHQQRTHELLREQVYAPGGLLERVMTALGFPGEAIEKRRQEFSAAVSPLTPTEWLASSASQATRHLWLGQVGQSYATVVSLGGIRDVAAIQDLASTIPDIRLIDRVAGTSEILSSYRQALSGLLALIYAIAGVVLTTRFGWRGALRILLPSVAATLTTLGLFGWFGVPINLFTMLALWLVLGLGIDYGIFLRHGLDNRPTAILSVTLSACTTLLAFGLLSFSATPFIRSIGLTLLCAITLSWLFVLFSCLTALPRPAPELETNHG